MEFLKKVAGASPLPAGGAAAAYTSCLAIGLIIKIILIEIHRHADQPEVEKILLTAKKELERLFIDAEKLIVEDEESFRRFHQSRLTGDDSQVRQSFSDTVEVSMKILEKSDATFEWIRQLRPMVPGQMVPHLLVACELFLGAIKGTAHVVRDNLKSIKPSEKRENYLKRVNDLQEDYQKKYLKMIDDLL